MRAMSVKIMDILTMSRWVSVRERLELSGLFLAAQGSGQVILLRCEIRTDDSLILMMANYAVFTILWAPIEPKMYAFLRWMILFTVWTVAATAVSSQMAMVSDYLTSVEVPAPMTEVYLP